MKTNAAFFRNVIFLIGKVVRMNPLFACLKAIQIIAKSFEPVLYLLFIQRVMDNLQAEFAFSAVLKNVTGLAVSWLALKCLQKLLVDRVEREELLTMMKVKSDLAQAISHLPYQDFEAARIKDLIQLSADQGPFIRVMDHFSLIVNRFFVIVSLTVLVSRQSVLIVLLMVVTVLFRLVVDGRNRKVWGFWREKYAPINRHIGYLFELMYNPIYGKELRASQAESIVEDQIGVVSKEYMRVSQKHNQQLVKNNAAADFVVLIQEVFVYLSLGVKVIARELTVGNFVMIIGAVQQYSANLLGLVSEVSELILDASFIEEYRWFMQTYTKAADQEGSTLKIDSRHPLTIEFQNVSFTYPGNEEPTLEDISVTIRGGESLSIVGENGAGKSTFVKLLCGLYAPTSGKILVNQRDLQSYTEAERAALFGAIFQDFKLLAFSVAEALVGVQAVDNDKLTEVLSKVGLKQRFEELTAGTRSFISKEFSEAGIEFSGGEMQKIALARMIYKDASIMILDEPTAAMDPLAEYELYSGFGELVREKTAIYISHRLSSTRFTDQILVLENGRVIEYGSHHQLAECTDGAYAKMFATQADWYKQPVAAG